MSLFYCCYFALVQVALHLDSLRYHATYFTEMRVMPNYYQCKWINSIFFLKFGITIQPEFVECESF